VSVTVLDALHELSNQLAAGDTQLWTAGLPPAALDTARRTHWWPRWEHDARIWPDVHSATDAADGPR
jgi:hypothetical protein